MLKISRIIKFFSILFIMLILGGCSDSTSFKKGDIKDDFCGPHINFQYCKCAFHGDYCDSIGMKKGEAKDYVNKEYDKWVESELDRFKNDCENDNGILKGKKCVYCTESEVVSNGKCVEAETMVLDDEEENDEGDEENEEGECKYDSDCESICEGSTMWKMGCNARTNTCEKTFDTDCSADIETFGAYNFPKICQAGACIRDDNSISMQKEKLIEEKKLWSDTVKEINATRDSIRDAMLEANKNCINGIADMTNVAIIEFSTRIASVLAGGIPDVAAMTASAAEHAAGLMQDNMKNLAGAAVDYAGEALNRLYNYQSGEPAEAEKKLTPAEYIKLNCDLYEYFKGVQAESDADLQQALDNANRVDQASNLLP
jgi:hypothetical protein